MAEILAVTGGIASFAQILAYSITASRELTELCDNLRDAPAELHRIRDQAILLCRSLDSLQRHLGSFDDDILLPLDLRLLVRKAMRPVWNTLIELQRQCPTPEELNAETLRKRVKWMAKERRTMHKIVERLKDAENDLSYILQILLL